MTSFVFGYGSLVNESTHAMRPVRPARVSGWKREWRHTALRPVAFLTATPDPTAQIDGLLAAVPDADWAELDLREAAYVRCTADIADADAETSAQIYHVPEGHHAPATTLHPVLLSYIDIVVAGYLGHFGEAGVRRFFDSTEGWDAPILDDRSAPRYSRYRPVNTDIPDLTDAHLNRVGARKI